MRLSTFLILALGLTVPQWGAAAILGGDDLKKCQNEQVASALSFKYCYKDKVAAEEALKQLKAQFANQLALDNEKIQALETEVTSLSEQLAAMGDELAQEKATSGQRITELSEQLAILQAQASDKEQALLKANQELEARYSKLVAQLQGQLKDQVEAHRLELEKLRKDNEALVRKLQQTIDNLSEELANLKKLTKDQKAELERMKAQENELAQQLEQEIKNGEIRLKKFHNKLIINIDNRLSFDSGSAKLKPEVLGTIGKIAQILANYPENRIVIEGHTDSDPIGASKFEDNWQLSSERALSVLRYLLKNTDLDKTRFNTAGFGEFQPLVPNDKPENKALNRRVDIVVIPRVQ